MISNATTSVVRRLFIKWKRAPMFIVGGLVGPILYLLLFGQAFDLSALMPQSQVSAALLGAPDYFSYFAVGMVSFASVSTAIFSGVNALFDRMLGVMQRTVVAPARRSSIFAGYLVFQTILTVIPALIVLTCAFLFHYTTVIQGLTITQPLTPLSLVEIAATIVLLSLCFTAPFLALGFMSKDQNTYFGFTAMLQLPILLTSNAMYPQTTMPAWLQRVVSINPITMATNVLRENMFGSKMYTDGPLVYMFELAAWTTFLVVLSLLLVRRSFISEG